MHPGDHDLNDQITDLQEQLEVVTRERDTYIEVNNDHYRSHHLLMNKLEYMHEQVAKWQKKHERIQVVNNTLRNKTIELTDRIKELEEQL